MMLREFLSELDKILPFDTAEEWDNCGLQVGDPNRETGDVALALDATHEALDAAIAKKCGTLVTHHPLIFPTISNIDTSRFVGSVIEKAVKNDIAIVALHTNWDKGGLNDALAELLGLVEIQKFNEKGFGLIGRLPHAMDGQEFSQSLKASWGLSRVACHGGAWAESGKKISRVGICGGAGGELWTEAASAGADVFVTAEVKLHQRIAADFEGLLIAEADHREMEQASLPALAALIAPLAKAELVTSRSQPRP